MSTVVSSTLGRMFTASALAAALFCAGSTLAQSVLPFQDAFEEYTGPVVAADGTGSNGWAGVPSTGDVAVTTAVTYTPAAGYPIPATNHERVVEFQGTISNAFDTSAYFPAATNAFETNNLKRQVWVDAMLQAGHVDFEPSVDSGAQVAAYVNTNGHVCIYHAYYSDDFTARFVTWTELQHSRIESGQWVRVTITLDYLSSATNPLAPPQEDWSLDEHFFQVQINGGDPITNARGFIDQTPGTLPDDYGGSWFLTADSGFLAPTRGNRFFSGLEIKGRGMLDDVVVTDQPVSFAPGYYVNATWTPGSGGQIAPAGSVRVPEGSNQVFTITANPNFTLSDVLVNNESIGPTNEYTFVNVMSNQTIHAVFAGSQTPLEEWLDSYGLSGDPTGDADSDGLSNEQEFYAGTIPTGPGSTQSVFKVVSQQIAPGSHTVQWYAPASNGTFSGFLIYRATNLMGAWELKGTNDTAPAPNGISVWTDPSPPATGPAFYQPRIPTTP